MLRGHTLHMLRPDKPGCRDRVGLEKWIHRLCDAVHVRYSCILLSRLLSFTASSLYKMVFFFFWYFVSSSLSSCPLCFDPFPLTILLLFLFSSPFHHLSPILLTLLTSHLSHPILHSIQYMRHLHEKVHKLDERTAPPAPEDETAKQAAEAAASIYGAPMMMMGNEMLMIQNGGGYSKFFSTFFHVFLCVFLCIHYVFLCTFCNQLHIFVVYIC